MGRQTVERELLYENVVSGDRPSLYVMGLSGAESLQKTGVAVFMVDVLGRVQLMRPETVKVLATPVLRDEDLDPYPEDTAIELMVKQGSSEDDVLSYLKRRKAR